MMLRNGQTYFEYLAVFTPQDISSIFGLFSTLYGIIYGRPRYKILVSS